MLVKCDNYTDPSAPSLPSSQKVELLIIYVSFQFHFSMWWREESPRGWNRENAFQRLLQGQSFLCSWSQHGWWLEGHSHRVAHSRVLLLSSLYPFFRKQNQPGSPGPSAEAGRARIQSVLIELALKQLIESQLLSLNGQFYCILMENVIIGWAQLTENTFLSLSLSHFCSHPQPIVNRIWNRKLVKLH